MTLSLSCISSVTAGASTGDYSNTLFQYRSSSGNDYTTTSWRNKKCSIEKDGIHGYIYAIASEVGDASVSMRKKTNAGSDVSANRNGNNSYWTVPYMTHTNLYNIFNKNQDSMVRLRVRTNSNKGSVSGYWSPDSSKRYGNVIG